MNSKIAICALIIVFAVSSFQANAQITGIKAYKEGSVWSMSFIKLKPNMGDDYLKSISTTWRKVHEEAVKQGMIVSFKVLSGEAANPGDWDIMLMTEYKNMAAMDNSSDKWDELFRKVVGTDDTQKMLNETRINQREIYGGKLMREIIFNPIVD